MSHVGLRTALALIGAIFITVSIPVAHAQSLGGSAKNILGDAADSALDDLAKPGAFYADKAVRILLPGPLKKVSSILRFTNRAGLTKDLSRSLNDAAGLAAKEAKPVFRAAIDNMSLTDGVGILTNGSTGGTKYLRRTAGGELTRKIRPLVETALGKVGAFGQLEKLGNVRSLGALGGVDLSRSGLIDSVTDQAMDGIFTYIGRKESKFRKNPLDKGKSILDGIFKK